MQFARKGLKLQAFCMRKGRGLGGAHEHREAAMGF
jgi:hypothetical protein